jgi:hypothetical protein
MKPQQSRYSKSPVLKSSQSYRGNMLIGVMQLALFSSKTTYRFLPHLPSRCRSAVFNRCNVPFIVMCTCKLQRNSIAWAPHVMGLNGVTNIGTRNSLNKLQIWWLFPPCLQTFSKFPGTVIVFIRFMFLQ